VKCVQMLPTPVKEDLQDVMKLGKSGGVAHQNTTPDERTDRTQDDTQLINAGQIRCGFHALSVTRCESGLKVSPRNLALPNYNRGKQRGKAVRADATATENAVQGYF
jgi:hypothetical protein